MKDIEKNEYLEFFTDGKYNLPSVDLPENVMGAEYTLGNKRIMTVWNNSDEEIEVNGRILQPQGVDIIEMEW